MRKNTIQLSLTAFLNKKFRYLLRKCVAISILVAFLVNQSTVWANPYVFQKPTLQQPTIVSSWNIPDIKNKAAYTYINFYLKEMESDPLNQNITRMEKAIRDVLSKMKSDPEIPDEIKKYLPEKPELEGDGAVYVKLGGDVYIRYYNPDIYRAEIPSFLTKNKKYDVEEIAITRTKDRDIGYLSKQVVFRGDPLNSGKYSLIEMIRFFKAEIDKNYHSQGIKDDKTFGSALFVDSKKEEVRELEDTPAEPGKLTEHTALNRAIRKVIFERKQKALGRDDPLVKFLSGLDNPAGKKVNVYIFKNNELRKELGDFKYLASGLITHAGTNNGKTYNLFIPQYIYMQMKYLIQYEPMNEDIAFMLSLWGYHELEHLEKLPDEDNAYPEDIIKESAMQLWLYSNAMVNFLAAKVSIDPKIKLKELKLAAKLIQKALEYRRDYFFIRELEGHIYSELSKIMSNEKNFSRALSGYTIALSDLSMQAGEILDDHPLVFSILDLLERWSGKRADGVIPKKAKTRLNYAIKNILDPNTIAQADVSVIKKFNRLVEENLGSYSLNDPFIPKFSMVPVVIKYLEGYQKRRPDVSIIKNLLLMTKKDVPKEDEDYEQKSKTWDDLKVKVYHFCGKIFMTKNNFNSWIDASLCFEQELECEQYYPEAYTLLVESRLKYDRSAAAIRSLREIVALGIERLGKVDVVEEALTRINKTESENNAMYSAINEKFSEGKYSECLSDIKKIEKKYPHVMFSQRYIDLKNIAKKLKADKKAAFRVLQEGRNEQAADMLKAILVINPTDVAVGKANVKVLIEIEEKERQLFALAEHVSHGAAANSVKNRINSADKYIEEAIRFAEVKGRILRARQRYDMAEESLTEAKKLLDPVVFDDHDITQFSAVIREVNKRIETGRKKIEGLPDKITIKKEKVKPETKKRKKQSEIQQDKNEKVKPEPGSGNGHFVPKIFISAKVQDFLEESQDKNALSNNIVSGFGRILNNSFTGKKKWRSGKENMNISRMKLGRHYRLFYTSTSDGDLIALSIMRRSDSKYMNPKLLDIFPKGGSADDLKSGAITLDEFKLGIQNGENAEGESGNLKAPFSTFADEDENYDDNFVERMLSASEEIKERNDIWQAVSFINKKAPQLNGNIVDVSKIRLFTVDLPALGLGFPMNEEAWQPSELIYAYGKKVSNNLEIYVTKQFYDQHLKDNIIALAEVIDHEYGENILGQSHRVSASRARLFIPENEFLSSFHLFYIKLITRYKESSMELEVLPDRVPSDDVRIAYANDEKSINEITGYEKKLYRHYLMSKEFYSDAQKSLFFQDESISYVIDGKAGKPVVVYISEAEGEDIERLYDLDQTALIDFLLDETVLKLYTKDALGKDKIRGGVSMKKEKQEKYGVPAYSIPNIVVEEASRAGQEKRELKYVGWKLLEFAVKKSLKDPETGGAVVVFEVKDLSVINSSLKRLGFKDQGNGVFLLRREDARAFLNKIDNLFKGASWFLRMKYLSAKGKELVSELSQKTDVEQEFTKAIEAMDALSSGMEKKIRNAPLYPDIQKDLTVELINSRASLALLEAKKLKRISEGLNFKDFGKIIAPLSSINMLTYSRENLYQKYGARLLAEVDQDLSASDVRKALDYATFQSIYVAHSLITFLLVEYLMFQFPNIKEYLDPSVREALSDISVLKDEDSLFDSTADMLEDALNFMTSITEVAYDKNRNKEIGLDHCWGNEKIIKNAERIIPRLIQSMIKLSGTISEEDDKRKVIVLLDSDISDISSGKIKDGLNEFIDTLSMKKENKRALGLFLRNLEIRKGEGKELLSKKGNVPEKDIVVLTSSRDYGLFKELESKGSLLTVFEKDYQGEEFPQDAYLPLVEVLFLSLIKYMHINSKEDLKAMLVEIYNHIPNVIALDDLISGEYKGITSKNTNKIIIRLIPDAKKFESSDYTDPMDIVLEFLVKA